MTTPDEICEEEQMRLERLVDSERYDEIEMMLAELKSEGTLGKKCEHRI